MTVIYQIFIITKMLVFDAQNFQKLWNRIVASRFKCQNILIVHSWNFMVPLLLLGWGAGYSKSTKSPLNATAESWVDRRVDLFQARARAEDVVEETLRRILNAVDWLRDKTSCGRASSSCCWTTEGMAALLRAVCYSPGDLGDWCSMWLWKHYIEVAHTMRLNWQSW